MCLPAVDLTVWRNLRVWRAARRAFGSRVFLFAAVTDVGCRHDSVIPRPVSCDDEVQATLTLAPGQLSDPHAVHVSVRNLSPGTRE